MNTLRTAKIQRRTWHSLNDFTLNAPHLAGRISVKIWIFQAYNIICFSIRSSTVCASNDHCSWSFNDHCNELPRMLCRSSARNLRVGPVHWSGAISAINLVLVLALGAKDFRIKGWSEKIVESHTAEDCIWLQKNSPTAQKGKKVIWKAEWKAK